jgi:hypothetical protein
MTIRFTRGHIGDEIYIIPTIAITPKHPEVLSGFGGCIKFFDIWVEVVFCLN